jgi:hypothetical protein
MPLSITALASWCSAAAPRHDWLAGLPIDEAVPMFFRLGGTAKPYDDKSWVPVHEPLCRGSMGLSTDESWPEVSAIGRVYLFAPGPWRPTQLAALAELHGRPRPVVLLQPNREVDVTSNITILRTGSALEAPIAHEESQ